MAQEKPQKRQRGKTCNCSDTERSQESNARSQTTTEIQQPYQTPQAQRQVVKNYLRGTEVKYQKR